jgi:hypothetical protein
MPIFSQYRFTLYSTAEPWRPLEVRWGLILYVYYCIYIGIQLGHKGSPLRTNKTHPSIKINDWVMEWHRGAYDFVMTVTSYRPRYLAFKLHISSFGYSIPVLFQSGFIFCKEGLWCSHIFLALQFLSDFAFHTVFSVTYLLGLNQRHPVPLSHIICSCLWYLKVHKRENFLGFDFEICTFS